MQSSCLQSDGRLAAAMWPMGSPALLKVCPSCGAGAQASVALPQGADQTALRAPRQPAVRQEQSLEAAMVLTMTRSCYKQTALLAHSTVV